ncbi:uncharacterized protein LOC108739769 [Agrilus planipennis]|uniref:Uncharacterized protein LOC108739769 n=1 Tax=Agrilus planipennis TaxID=224129 RepID=A0A7F5R6N1_AGRPL|nr:uncharacterized protein LOC108739769 [Agrilus planipennis]
MDPELMENEQLDQLSSSVTIEIIPSHFLNQSSSQGTQHTAIIPAIKQESAHGESSSEEEVTVETVAGVHFLTDNEENATSTQDNNLSYEKKKSELLEYMIRDDGSVTCKLCGEVLASRTHWYRHKYKLHVNNLLNPAPLFKCVRCNVFFKSRKGFMGHVGARHADDVESHDDTNVVIKEEVVETPSDGPKTVKYKKEVKPVNWEEQREKEEKLVADIIDRVRKECEAQGTTITRRGYSRRSTVMMNSCT